MNRTPRERVELLKQWAARRREKHAPQPPVEIRAPGLDRRRKPNAEQLRSVRRMVEAHSHQAADLPRPAMAKVLPLLEQAKREVARDLNRWLQATPDGNMRFTAQRYSGALLALRGATDSIRRAGAGLYDAIDGAREDAAQLASDHLVREVARMSEVFDGHEIRLKIDMAAVVAVGEKYMLPEYRSSAARYAGDVGRDIQQQLAIGVALNESVFELTERLVKLGGPAGRVAVLGIDGQPGAVTQHIAEGLFARYRWWAERIVRDQLSTLYTFQALAAYHEAAQVLPDLEKRWDATVTRTTCKECAALDGVVVELNSLFPGGVDGAPLHPCCRCRTGAWRAHWTKYMQWAREEDEALAIPARSYRIAA